MRFGDFEITKREVLASISIIAIMLAIGMGISGAMNEARLDKNETYNKAVKIETADLFEYGMRTNIGNAFVYGDLKAVDTVTYPEIDGQYMFVEKVTEQYTRHTRQVAHTRTVNGKTQTYYTTEVYWTWDPIDWDTVKSKEVTFLDVTFASDKFDLPGTYYIGMIQESSRIRYKYYGLDVEYTGTIFTDLRDDTIKDDTDFYVNKDITETVEYLEAMDFTILFWIAWIFIIFGCVYGFYYIDNKWLE